MLKDLLRSADLSRPDLEHLLALAEAYKRNPYRQRALLSNDTVVLYFNKPSTRTRLSFETAVARLGATPLGVGPSDLQLGRGETIEDTARVVSRYARAFVIRTYAHAEVARFAQAASIPVINALTDAHHPCQSLADLLTLRERFGPQTRLRLAYFGDGNNVAHSLMEAGALAGLDVAVATPQRYAPAPEVVTRATALAAAHGGRVVLTEDPAEAACGAHALYTDVWLSMGQPEAERAERWQTLQPYQVNAALMSHARPEAIFMHCLPDHRGEEVSAEIVDGPRSVVFDQAENRLHTAAAVLEALVRGELHGTAPA